MLSAVSSPLRLLIYDARTDLGDKALRSTWAAGARVYRGLGRVDAFHGASSWPDALEFLGQYEPDRPIGEVQYWGHGNWGRVLIGADALTRASFDPGHSHRPGLERFKQRLLPDGASLVWLRTCEAFGAHAGQRFAKRLADELRARVAGHTYIIGPFQSGLHGLRPGQEPRWSPEEGLLQGTADRPSRARQSSPFAPHTIQFMQNGFPEGWFDA